MPNNHNDMVQKAFERVREESIKRFQQAAKKGWQPSPPVLPTPTPPLVGRPLTTEERIIKRVTERLTAEMELEAKLRIQRLLLAVIRKHGYGVVPRWAIAIADGINALLKQFAGAILRDKIEQLVRQKAGASREELAPGTWQRDLVDVIYQEFGLQ